MGFEMPDFLLFLLIVFQTSITFADTIKLNVATHNLHGFKTSSDYHRSCLKRLGGVWMGQELWLSERQLSTMSSIGTQYVARSGMEDALA